MLGVKLVIAARRVAHVPAREQPLRRFRGRRDEDGWPRSLILIVVALLVIEAFLIIVLSMFVGTPSLLDSGPLPAAEDIPVLDEFRAGRAATVPAAFSL
jgi:hypothetical protein